MPKPSLSPAGATPPSRASPRPWLLGLAGIALFLAGGVLGAILVLSTTLYHLPAADPPELALDQAPTLPATVQPTEALPPTPSPQPTATALPTPSRIPTGPGVGQLAPNFKLLDLEGIEHQLTDYRGQPVLINFWASWCPPCRQEWPDLRIFAERFSQGVMVLAVNVEESSEVIYDFIGYEELPFLVLLDDHGYVSDHYRANSLPTTFLLDKDGFVRQVVPGNMNLVELERLVSTILAEP